MHLNAIYNSPKNELQINIPFTFIQKGEVLFNWTELYWGWINRFILDETLIELAEMEVANDTYTEETLELASIMKSEVFTEKKKIKEIMERIIEQKLLRNESYILNCKNKYLYVVLSYIYQYPIESKVIPKINEYFNNLSELSVKMDLGYENVLEFIIEEFQSPSIPAQKLATVLFEWVAYNIPANEKLIKPWHMFLENQRSCFVNQWDMK